MRVKCKQLGSELISKSTLITHKLNVSVTCLPQEDAGTLARHCSLALSFQLNFEELPR